MSIVDSRAVAISRPRIALGSRRQAPRPVVLLIVFGVFLVVVAVTTTAQTFLVSAHFSTAALTEVIGSDAGSVRTFVNLNVTPGDLTPSSSGGRRAQLSAGLGALVRNGRFLHAEIRLPDGAVLASDDPAVVGERRAVSSDFATAVGGSIAPAVLAAGDPSESGVALAPANLLREYIPISTAGAVKAVVAVWRDAGPLLAAMDDVRRAVVIVTVSGAIVAAVFLFLVFRSAQARISRQTLQLMDSTRRDPLTGLLNHGALLGILADRIEAARDDGSPIAVGLLDVDGFRLVNEVYGHEAGDRALLQVARLVAAELDDVTVGRYGPDEFLAITDAARIADLEPAVDRVRGRLAAEALDVVSTDRIPVSLSAGISVYPDDADSVTALLGSAVQALAEAKASGGDAVRLAGRVPVPPADEKAFDVFQGLILAVDTKDRYTKRHSEDVARYATFLANRIGLDRETVRTIRVAGLLHDVGKIGIPDAILRKPGRLTADEHAIVKQHVAVGDLILRDLPNLDLIRAGVRHHHEHWNGRGYLDALAGDDIPEIARILAVGDAFSAMTTTRPYRKALSVSEALRRLEDAAGSQLEERLVTAFVDGIRTAADAPLPGAELGMAGAWIESDQVA